MSGEQPPWASASIDQTRPSASRVYDFLLGGANNFEVDRELAEQLLAIEPDARRYAWVNRHFLRRATRFLVDEGIRQFIDLGSGIPTVGAVHTEAQGKAPGSRVVYVDVDPVAVAHGRALLAGNELVRVVHADVRRPERIIASPDLGEVIDFGEPVAVLMVALLHFVSDADGPAGIVGRFREVLAPGSFLVISHVSPPRSGAGAARAATVLDAYQRTATPLTLRSRSEIGALFAGFDLVAPGLVEVGRWRPFDEAGHDEPVPGFAGVGVLR
jgi:hypothetical protein